MSGADPKWPLLPHRTKFFHLDEKGKYRFNDTPESGTIRNFASNIKRELLAKLPRTYSSSFETFLFIRHEP